MYLRDYRIHYVYAGLQDTLCICGITGHIMYLRDYRIHYHYVSIWPMLCVSHRMVIGT